MLLCFLFYMRIFRQDHTAVKVCFCFISPFIWQPLVLGPFLVLGLIDCQHLKWPMEFNLVLRILVLKNTNCMLKIKTVMISDFKKLSLSLSSWEIKANTGVKCFIQFVELGFCHRYKGYNFEDNKNSGYWLNY